MSLRILHIAPFNTSGVPIAFVRAERKLGHLSRLVTLARDRRGYEEDISLDLPFLDFIGTRMIKRLISNPDKLEISNRARVGTAIPITWEPHGPAERTLVQVRERIWRSKISALFETIDFWNFDVYQLDGGLEFYRSGATVKELKARGKTVICCYTGSDLRTRGVIPAIDSRADVNVTVEYDHLKLHPDIHHVPFPFEVEAYPYRPGNAGNENVVRIGHAPTNRAAKGSDQIIAAVQKLKQSLPVELVLIENVSFERSMELKSQCHIFVDQIGDLGYGLNSLEALAIGIPACSCLAPGFASDYPDHPFVVIDSDNIVAKLSELVTNPDLRRKIGRNGRQWLKKHHDSVNVVRRIHQLAGVADDAKQEIQSI